MFTRKANEHQKLVLNPIISTQLLANYLIFLIVLIKKSECFEYILSEAQEITAPEMLCFAGDAASTTPQQTLSGSGSLEFTSSKNNNIGIHSLPCPNTQEQISSYPATILDEKGHVVVKLNNVIMRDDGRRRSRQDDSEYRRHLKQEDLHHLQIYLMDLEQFSQVLDSSQCCYEYELQTVKKQKLPTECTAPHNKHDYRVNAPRIGQMAAVTSPMSINAKDEISVDVKLQPLKRGKYIVVISNCAAELSLDPVTNATLAKGIKAVIQGGLEIEFVSQYGELPISMMGIIPFYGVLALSYAILNIIWLKRLRRLSHSKKYDSIPPSTLLGVQKAIHALLMAQATFTTMAFLYYLHLNTSRNVDIHVLYNGTAAALISWKNPFSIIIALVHFCTIFGCQCVATLASDGTWLIQSTIRISTRIALHLLAFSWIVYFVLYSFLSIQKRRYLLFWGGAFWILFLFYNVNKSLRHLRSLMVGHLDDSVLAIGGAIVAKRKFYRKMCVVIAVYPFCFFVSLVYTNKNKEDSWAWLGYVLGDIYLFILLIHAYCIWIPRSMASQEFVKYAPLEVAATNDADMWEGDDSDAHLWEDEDGRVEMELS